MVHQFRKSGAYFCYLLFMLLVLVSVGFAQEIDTGNIVILPETDVVQVDSSASPFTSINGLQATTNVPPLVDVHTRRNAGSQLVEALATVDVTDLTIGVSGLVPATQAVISLSQDPTGEDPYDNLNDGTTSFIVVSVPPGAARFVAETFESAGANIDLFMGTGLTPSADTEICAGAGETAVEVCNVDTPIAGDWWILVQNRAESAAPPDTFTLAYGVVSNDVGNMWVEAPSTVPPASVFELNVLWDEPALAAGSLWYGSFTVGSDPGQPENIGRVNVDLERHEDDVEKIVSAETAVPGDVLTYTITMQPNVTSIDLTYYITDTIPAGLTYVPNSATASVGQVSVLDDTLTWSDLLPIGHTYDVVTSLEEPTCSPPLAEADGEVDDYLDLAAFGIVPDPNIIGDSVVYSVNFDGGEFDFFGADRGELIYFTDDGFAFFAPSGPGLLPGTNEPIPTAADPNNLMALYWRDLELVYDQALNRGVSLVNLTSDSLPVAAVVEFDDVEETPAGTGLPTYDFEIIAYYDPGPDHYEFIFAYDNLTPADGIGTIGLESQSGTSGVQFAYNDVAISDGMAICYDLIEAGNAPVEVTYQARVDVDAQGSLENQAVHKTNDPGSKEESVSATVMVAGSSSTKLLISSNSGGYVNDLPFADEDILLFDMGTNNWSMYFDGSDLGLRPADIDALHIMDDGTILMSFSQRFKVPRLGKVDDSDIVRFIPISLGEDTDGSFELFFDGSDVGLTSNGEDVDAINVTEDGRLIVSTSGNFRIPANRCWWHWISKKCGHDVEVDETLGSNYGKKRPHFKNMLLGRDEDLIVFDPMDLGKKTKGTWDYYLNGWAAQLIKEDIWGVWVDDATDDIYLTVQNKFELDSVGGDGQDIFVCHPIFLGMFTSCDYEAVLFFDGSETGLGRQRINGFSIIR